MGTAANRAQAPARGAVPDGSTALVKAASPRLLRAMFREDHARRTIAATPDTTQDAPWPRGTYSPARPPCRPPPWPSGVFSGAVQAQLQKLIQSRPGRGRGPGDDL